MGDRDACTVLWTLEGIERTFGNGKRERESERHYLDFLIKVFDSFG